MVKEEAHVLTSLRSFEVVKRAKKTEIEAAKKAKMEETDATRKEKC